MHEIPQQQWKAVLCKEQTGTVSGVSRSAWWISWWWHILFWPEWVTYHEGTLTAGTTYVISQFFLFHLMLKKASLTFQISLCLDVCWLPESTGLMVKLRPVTACPASHLPCSKAMTASLSLKLAASSSFHNLINNVNAGIPLACIHHLFHAEIQFHYWFSWPSWWMCRFRIIEIGVSTCLCNNHFISYTWTSERLASDSDRIWKASVRRPRLH